MRENRLRTLWQNDQAAVNGWLAIPNSFSAETMAHQGWDTLTIDLQHGVIDYQAMVPMLQAISTTPTVPIVRVPWLEPGIIMKSLDAGAYGLICPMVNTREDAQKFVAWSSYAPQGTRSFGPVRALLYGGADYPQHANDTIVRFAMIETAQALDNLDAIMSVEGLDAIYIGPSDLSLALGCRPVFDDVDPPVAQAIDHILERATAHGVKAGMHNGIAEGALARIAKGFRFVTVSSDARLMAAGSQQVLAKMRAAPAKRPHRAATDSPRKDHYHEDRIHRPGHHGRADGGPPPRRRPQALRQHRRQGAGGPHRGRRHGVRDRQGSGAEGRHRLHDGARHARRGGGAVRRERRGRGLSKGKTVVDMSSISPIETKEFAKKINELGCDYLDAPVSGGEVGAKAASLTIMVGGPEAAFDRVKPLFELMGKNITLVGGNGDGQTTKVANQIIVALNIAAVGEALVFASKAGADPAKVRQALMGGFASSRILEVHGERMIKRTFNPGFRIGLHQKDLNLALAGARALGVALPQTAGAAQLMQACAANGMAELDHSALVRALELMANHEVAP